MMLQNHRTRFVKVLTAWRLH